MFRYERPQKGRQRQFHQIGVELIGVPDPQADVEVIALGRCILDGLGLKGNVTLELNTLGDPESRETYRGALVGYLSGHLGKLSADSRERLERNPLRILDSVITSYSIHYTKLYDARRGVAGIFSRRGLMPGDAAVVSRRLLGRIRDVMAKPGLPEDRLNVIVRCIAEEMQAAVCSCYVMRAGEVLELFATEGLRKSAVHQTRLRVGEGLVGFISYNFV